MYGQDGHALADLIWAKDAPTWLREIPTVEALRVMLMQNYQRIIHPDGSEVIKRREKKDGLPPGRSHLVSPYDQEARRSAKRGMVWSGYKVHLSETCDEDDDRPHLITNVVTTSATVADAAVTGQIHQRLHARALSPDEHFVDAGYPRAVLVQEASQRYGVALVALMVVGGGPGARDAASFGVALGSEAASGTELLALADQRLLLAKKDGRNRVVGPRVVFP